MLLASPARNLAAQFQMSDDVSCEGASESDDSDDDYLPVGLVDVDQSDDETEVAEREVVPRRSKRKNKSKPVYHGEKVDDFFEGEKGYSHVGRTRKGGDRRPRAVKKVR